VPFQDLKGFIIILCHCRAHYPCNRLWAYPDG
jgi:hypothetical protein